MEFPNRKTNMASLLQCYCIHESDFDLSFCLSVSVCSHSSQSTEETGFNDPSLLENLQSNHVSTVMASQLLSHAQPARNVHTGRDIHILTPPVSPHGWGTAHINSICCTPGLFMKCARNS